MRCHLFHHLVVPAVALLAGPWAAAAAPEAEGSVTLTEPNGAFTAVKTFQVFAADNPENPRPLAGNFTYVYTIANQPDSFICLVGYDLEVPAGSVTDAGFVDGAGVEPSAISVGDLNVDWDFLTVGICPGQSSEKLFVHSTFGPGDANDNMVSVDGQFSLNTPGSCLGPFNPPEFVGEPLPCTIGFWKNRAEEKKGLLQFFPDPDFGGLVSDAVVLSQGTFADEAALLADLTSKGRRTTEERARQQLSALTLNLAAGDAFPDNTKCKLFEGNQITSNQCGDNLSVGDGLARILADLPSGLSCADDINNGIGVVQ